MVSYIDWSIEDFKKLPRGGRADNIESIVIIPSDEGIHDSGFRFMDFAIVENGEPRYIAGYNDFIHLLDSMWWGIDCLPCGLCRIYRSGSINLDCTFQAKPMEIEILEPSTNQILDFSSINGHVKVFSDEEMDIFRKII